MNTQSPGNNKKYFSLILVPHADGEIKYVRIPLWLCQLACVGIVLIITTFFVLMYYYRDLKATEEENQYIREENRALRVELEEIGEDKEMLSQKSEEIEDNIQNVAGLLDLDLPEMEEEKDKEDGE